MEQNPLLSNSKVNQASSGEANFRDFARPLTARLLEAMELAKTFTRGQGDFLFTRDQTRILDLTGGYGANLLGHRHPRLLKVVSDWSLEGAPSMTQGSQRAKAGELAAKISDILKRETGEGPWVSTFSNSGTEAIEAALKHCLIHFRHKLIDLQQEIEKEFNQSLISYRRCDERMQSRILIRLRSELTNKLDGLRMPEERKSYLLHQVANCHTIEDLVSLLREVNANQLKVKPVCLALEKSYHGKTMGALSLTYNPAFREEFYLGEENNTSTLFIPRTATLHELQEVVENTYQDLVFLTIGKQGVTVVKQSFSNIAGAFAEPIQGEAGIVPVPESTLANLKKFSLQENFLLVFDEIQAGMFRTGLMASGHHAHITADVYTFSKSLGGGIAKIAATTVIKRKYVDDFGFLHTSTFAEDDFSSAVALEVLTILEEENSPLLAAMETSTYLQARLGMLQKDFPDLLIDVRGRGLMLAIEFSESIFSNFGFEFKVICDAKMQGYLVASALLNHERIRMNPSLSNNLTLRLQPSVYFNHIQVEELISGLSRLLTALSNGNIQYFLAALYPGQEILNRKTPSLQTTAKTGHRPLSVFLCHMIDENHIRRVTSALKELPDQKLTEKLSLTKDLAEFQIYHRQTLMDDRGQEMDIIMLGVPVTSEELKKSFLSKNRYQIIRKVQQAVDYAKELGASTVGLGQFTSIVSGNGLYLDPRGMNLTTGNAYTISLTIQAALRSTADKGLPLERTHAAVIGACGNIMSVASSILADSVSKITLIHHSPLETSAKFQESVRKLLREICNSDAQNTLTDLVRRNWTEEQDVIEFLKRPLISQVLVATSDLTSLIDADLVLSGTSSSSGFLTPDMFKQNAVVVDVAVPPTLKKEFVGKLKTLRPDLTYHLGGVASLPQKQSIEFFLLPLEHNESYACMAETFSIGFSGEKNFLNIGDLDKSIVLKVTQLAQKAGFTLGRSKTSSSL
jgi:acetylornithine/succinyldiaminopimelate/putrescine aminotransferase/predicted amino acid dehydrogenase